MTGLYVLLRETTDGYEIDDGSTVAGRGVALAMNRGNWQITGGGLPLFCERMQEAGIGVKLAKLDGQQLTLSGREDNHGQQQHLATPYGELRQERAATPQRG